MHSYAYIATLCIQNCFLRCFDSGLDPFHKSGHKCFDKSGPLLQIRSHFLQRGTLWFQ